ncbi:hypothetical protein ACHAXT_000094 [Thalassiosira profunda]
MAPHRTAAPAALALLLLALIALVASTAAAAAPPPGAFGVSRLSTKSLTHHVNRQRPLFELRGGASADDSDYDSEYDSEYDSDDEEEEEEEPIVATAKKLASSTKSATHKRTAAAAKAKVKVAMASSGGAPVKAAKRGDGRSLYQRCVPYIVRACLNPFTLAAMTKAYFVSLCDVNYLKEEQSQTLRSALEQKARNQPPPSSGSTKPKRKMKPGQAKTLSDLPQLSA